MRIALVVDPLTLRTKGASHAPSLSRELLGRGHTVRGFGAPAGLIPQSGGSASLGVDGEEVDAARGLAGFEPDVIVAYDALSPAAWLGARACRNQGAALVLVEGGLPASSIRLHERLLQSLGEVLWGRFVRDSADRVVALDPVARSQALDDGFPPEKVQILPEGVDAATFRPGLSSALISARRLAGRVLLYLGPLDLSGGIDVLIQAFARTVGQRNDWHLLLAGDGAAAPRLRSLADRLGVSARVTVMPRLRREELPGILGAATLLAAPATDDKTRGRQVLRAMACGRPVIAADVERLRFYVQPEETGLLVTPGDLEGWTEALQRVAMSPEVRRRWGIRAREVVEERFAWPAVTEAFEEMFREVGAGSSGAEAEGPPALG